ncbi:MAG: type II CAAX endopeptidase family protein [Polyangiaceae bacterium]
MQTSIPGNDVEPVPAKRRAPGPFEDHLGRVHVWPALPLYAGIIIGLVVVFDPRLIPMPSEWGSIVATVIASIVLLVWWFRVVRPRGVPARDMLGPRLNARGWVLALGLALADLISKLALIVVIVALHGEPLGVLTPRSSPVALTTLGIMPLLATLFCDVILTPVVEEVLFRGTLFRKWRLRWGAGKAALASSVVFGLLHQDAIGATATGLLYVTVYTRSRTLWSCIAIHVLNNGIAKLGRIDGALEQMKSLAESLSTGPAAIALGLVGAVTTVCLALYIRSGWRTLDDPLPPTPLPAGVALAPSTP